MMFASQCGKQDANLHTLAVEPKLVKDYLKNKVQPKTVAL